jgi:two-component system, OmpR family, sensor histidine kinase CpxA
VQLLTGLNSFLAGHAGERVEAISRNILLELQEKHPDQWSAILARYSQLHNVQFIFINEQHERLAGEPIELPVEVRRAIPKGPPRPGFRPELRQGTDDGRELHTNRPPNFPPDFATADGPPPLPIHRRFFIHSQNPDAYWVGLMLALRKIDNRADGRGNIPGTLLVRSKTFSAGGLFFDYTPWFLAGGGVLLISVLFWLPLVRNISRSISQLTRATEQVAEGRFDVRVDEKRQDELGQLGAAVNRMNDRIAGFVTGQKRFLGDIAHELCSPIARLQMALGILEQRADEKQKPYLDDLREEIQHMSELVNELLSFSKASLKPGKIKLQLVNVKEIADTAARREANKGDVKVEVPESLTALANPDLLQRAISNLVRNALRYAGDAGPITVSATSEGNSTIIVVADHGPGVPEQHLDRIFDTFFRVEPSRDRETGGVGLGLTIVKTCINTCGGTVACRNRQPHGLEVVIKLNAR